MPAKKPPRPPATLLSAFRVEADSNLAAVAALLIDDGFDAGVMRILSAWSAVEVGWRKPSCPCPDDGQPTAAAWAWLCRGVEVDYDALAAAAGVTRPMAVRAAEMLLAQRLTFPDGSLAKPARAALQQHARIALGLKPPKDRRQKKPDPEPDPDDAN